MRRMWAAGAAVLTSLALVGPPVAAQSCAAGEAEAAGTVTGPATIGFANFGTGYWASDGIAAGVRQAADAAGVTLLTSDSGWDGQVQAGQIEDFIKQGVSAIVVLPWDPDPVVPAIAAANAVGIPVVAVSGSQPGGTIASLIGSDEVAGSRMAGEYLFEAMGGSGKVIAVGLDDPAGENPRAEGFRQALDAAPSISLAGQGSESATWDLLTAHPDVTGVFALDDYTALEVAVAVAAQGLADKVTVVSFEGSPDGLAAVKRGTLAATIAQQPVLMGRKAVETAIKAAAGETVEASIPIETLLVTSANVDQFLAPAAPLPSPASE
jgi:ribose transport system substrate-binding protein